MWIRVCTAQAEDGEESHDVGHGRTEVGQSAPAPHWGKGGEKKRQQDLDIALCVCVCVWDLKVGERERMTLQQYGLGLSGRWATRAPQ